MVAVASNFISAISIEVEIVALYHSTSKIPAPDAVYAAMPQNQNSVVIVDAARTAVTALHAGPPATVSATPVAPAPPRAG